MSTQPTYPRRVDAEQAWDDIKEARRRQAGLRAAIPTFRDYSRRWLDSLTPHMRPSSLLKYEWALRHLDDLAATPLDALDRETIRTLLTVKAKGLSPASAATVGSVLHTCLAEAVADGYIRINPAAGGGSLRKSRAERGKPKSLDAAQLRAFLTEAGPEWRDFFYVSWALGLRPGEAMALRPSDIDLERRRVLIERTVLVAGGVGPTKGGGSGWVDLAPGAATILRRRIATSPNPLWIFPGLKGRGLNHPTVERNFERIAARAGLPSHLTPHSLRHTFAVMLLTGGASVYYVQRMMRHKSIQVTVDVYGWCLDPGRPELTAAMEAGVGIVSAVSVADSAESVRVETA